MGQRRYSVLPKPVSRESISDFAAANKRTMLDQYEAFFVRLLESDEKVL